MYVLAKQYFSAAPAGFVWDASFSMAGIPAARAYDSHLDTQGRMFGRMLGLFTLMESQGYTVSRALTPQSHLQRAEHLLVAVYSPQHKYSITA